VADGTHVIIISTVLLAMSDWLYLFIVNLLF